MTTVRTLTALVSLLICTNAFGYYNQEQNPYTGLPDFVGVSKSSDVSIVCASGQTLTTTGSGTWGCEVYTGGTVTGSGTTGSLAKWASSSSLTDAVADTDYLTPATADADYLALNPSGSQTVDFFKPNFKVGINITDAASSSADIAITNANGAVSIATTGYLWYSVYTGQTAVYLSESTRAFLSNGFQVDYSGNVTANSFIKTGGLSTQFLMADGSVSTGSITALSAIGSSPNANAATITGSVLNLEPASASFGGVVVVGAQTIAGQKTIQAQADANKPLIVKGFSGTQSGSLFETQDSSGNILSGFSSSGYLGVGPSAVSLIGTNSRTATFTSNDPGTLAMVSFIGADATIGGPTFNGYKSRGTVASPTNSSADDTLMSFGGYGRETTYKSAAQIVFKQGSGAGSTNRLPGYFIFTTGNTASDAMTERMRLTSTGLSINKGSASASWLDVVGDNTKTSASFDNPNSGTAITTGFAAFEVVNSNATVGNYSNVFFTDAVSGAASAIMGVKFTDHTNNYGIFEFWTRAASGTGVQANLGATGLSVGNTTTAARARLDVVETTANAQAADFSVSNSGTAITNMTGISVANVSATTNNYSGVLFPDTIGDNSAVGVGAQHTDRTNNYGEYVVATRGTSGFLERARIGTNGGLTLTMPTDINLSGMTAIVPTSATTIGATYAGLSLVNTNTTNNNFARLDFLDVANGTSSAVIVARFVNHTTKEGNLLLHTNNGGARVERIDMLSTETVVNDGGNNFDFRVEGDTDPYLTYADASSETVSIGSSSTTAKLLVNGTAAATIVQLTKAAGSQSASIHEWQTSAGTVIQKVGSAGGLVIGDVANDTETNAWQRIKTTATGDTGLTIRLKASATGDALQVLSSAASANTADLFRIKADGDLELFNTDIILGTSTGTKIGTATTQKIGFYNATPIVQGASVADATGGVFVDAEARTAINDLISRMEATGLIATV